MFKTILKNLLKNEDYARKVLPFLKDEYFREEDGRVLFVEIKNFILKYNALPTIDILNIEIDKLRGIDDEKTRGLLTEINNDKVDTNISWLMESTEKFCQEEAIYQAMIEAMDILKDDSKKSKGAIPQLLSDALAISFDPNIGHDYFAQYQERYDFYHQIQEKIPFDLEFFNKITNNGMNKKTLNIALAGTGVGKSLFMCHVAAGLLNIGKKVLYITLELAEEEVSRRIDANLLNVTLDDLMLLPQDLYYKKCQNLRNKTNGELVVREYPTAGASVIHFEALLNELKLKKGFVPDIIFIDYINLCLSSRIKPGSGANSYTYIKSVAEELRGLAVKWKLPIVSATQTTRSGFLSSDPGLDDTSESFGLPATADFMFALIATEDLDKISQIMVKQLKNRYNDVTKNRKFVIGIDRAKMRLFDVEGSAQQGLTDSGQDDPVPLSLRDKFKKIKVEE